MKSILKGIIVMSVAMPVAMIGSIVAINVAGGLIKEFSNDANK